MFYTLDSVRKCLLDSLSVLSEVEEGAKHVLLLSRSGKPASDAGAQWAWLESSSVDVQSKKCDLEDAAALKKVRPCGFMFSSPGLIKRSIPLTKDLQDN